MAVYRSRHALTGPLTPDQVVAIELPRTMLCLRGYRPDDVHALLHRVAFELAERSRQLDQVRAENHRVKNALREWQADSAATRHRTCR